jgi:hypothetical protein
MRMRVMVGVVGGWLSGFIICEGVYILLFGVLYAIFFVVVVVLDGFILFVWVVFVIFVLGSLGYN